MVHVNNFLILSSFILVDPITRIAFSVTGKNNPIYWVFFLVAANIMIWVIINDMSVFPINDT